MMCGYKPRASPLGRPALNGEMTQSSPPKPPPGLWLLGFGWLGTPAWGGEGFGKASFSPGHACVNDQMELYSRR